MNYNKPVVMVADSDPYVRGLVGRYVEEAGYTVTFAGTGYEALDATRKSPPLAIIADMLLPKLDGLALCRLIKGDPETAHVITVIVLSILSAEEKAKKAGADAFIQKPLEKTRILETLDEACRQRGVDS